MSPLIEPSLTSNIPHSVSVNWYLFEEDICIFFNYFDIDE